MNLYTTDRTLEFMLDELGAQNSILSQELHNEMIFRINQRRTIYSDIMHYLYDPGRANEKNMICLI